MELAGRMVGRHGAFDDRGALRQLICHPADTVQGFACFAIARLIGWVSEPDANLRRFAIEIARSRGVWAKHIAQLRAEPWHGLPLLEPCRHDESRYVQDSVANWLNDAARSRPDRVREVCLEWLQDGPDNSACCYIVKRAQRNLSGDKAPPDEQTFKQEN
jgi:3-methyladenine DNA glycosylase AlkC